MHDLFFGSATGHSMMILSFVIGLGLLLGKVKVRGITLGAAWILIVAILFAQLGLRASPSFLHFIKEFGLVLFMFSVGMDMGPGFFNSFRRSGLKMNLLSVALVLLAIVCMMTVVWCGAENLDTMVGVLSGAVTNTPALGAAQEALYGSTYGTFLSETVSSGDASYMANAFTAAYPVAILTLILFGAMMLRVMKGKVVGDGDAQAQEEPLTLYVKVCNPAVFGKESRFIMHQFPGAFIITEILRDGEPLAVGDRTVVREGDVVVLETRRSSSSISRMAFGKEVPAPGSGDGELVPQGKVVSRKILISSPSITGKTLHDLDIRSRYGVTVARVTRSGVELVASGDLRLQVGDRLKIVGPEEGIGKVSKVFGNSAGDLEKPNLIPLFLGIGVAIILGSLSFNIPGLSSPWKLGLAGGPFVVAIILGYFGPMWKITTYTSASVMTLLRQVGLALLLGTIGLGTGDTFLSSIAQGGYMWFVWGALLALVPSLVVALVARFALGMDPVTVMGLVCGANTNPYAMNYLRDRLRDDRIAQSYTKVYPLAMFLWVMAAQILVLV